VVLREERWRHVVDGHPELASLEAAVLRAVSHPTRDRAGRDADERWYYLELVPPRPSRWLKVVVRYGVQDGWIVTAFLRRRMP